VSAATGSMIHIRRDSTTSMVVLVLDPARLIVDSGYIVLAE
jgi:hypothetical protein